MYSCIETICRWFTSSLSVSKSHFSFRKHELNKNKVIGDRGSLRQTQTQTQKYKENKWTRTICETSCGMGDTLCNGIVNCCNPLRKVELSSTSCNASHNKKLRDNPCYTVQFSSNLSRNAIARQFDEKIAQCNRAFTQE